MKALAKLESYSRPFVLAIGLVLIALIGILDVVTGYELSFSLFYLIPIGLIAWIAGRRMGIAAAVVGALVWLLADIQARQPVSQGLTVVWNALIRLGFFLVVTLLLAEVKNLLEREKILSRTDFVSGAVSAGQFHALLQLEIDRFVRYGHPFSVAYVDIDDFKALNDKFGHTQGDQILRSVVAELKGGLRKTDVVARLGGDEFAVLLPETDQKRSPLVISRIQQDLVTKMADRGWGATFSIGTVAFLVAPKTTDEAIKLADELMYSVKRSGKNGVKFSVHEA